MAGGIEEEAKKPPTALKIGYIITTFGFLLFFGPLSVKLMASDIRAAAQTAGVAAAAAHLLPMITPYPDVTRPKPLHTYP